MKEYERLLDAIDRRDFTEELSFRRGVWTLKIFDGEEPLLIVKSGLVAPRCFCELGQKALDALRRTAA